MIRNARCGWTVRFLVCIRPDSGPVALDRMGQRGSDDPMERAVAERSGSGHG